MFPFLFRNCILIKGKAVGHFGRMSVWATDVVVFFVLPSLLACITIHLAASHFLILKWVVVSNVFEGRQ